MLALNTRHGNIDEDSGKPETFDPLYDTIPNRSQDRSGTTSDNKKVHTIERNLSITVENIIFNNNSHNYINNHAVIYFLTIARNHKPCRYSS